MQLGNWVVYREQDSLHLILFRHDNGRLSVEYPFGLIFLIFHLLRKNYYFLFSQIFFFLLQKIIFSHATIHEHVRTNQKIKSN